MELKQVTIEETKLALSLLKESAEWLKKLEVNNGLRF